MPNHVASLIACLTGMMLIQSIDANKSLRQKNQCDCDSWLNVCFGSRTVSMGHTGVCNIWVIWMLVKSQDKKNLQQIALMALVGAVASWQPPIHTRSGPRRFRTEQFFRRSPAIVVYRPEISSHYGIY